jgi:RNA polymerase sigma factor (TIGR02999 family)
MSVSENITALLKEWGNGSQAALDKLMPLVYEELRKKAEKFLRSESKDHSLQTTGLVHEAYLRLIDQREVKCENRSDFFKLAAMLMRRILVNHANAKKTTKRGGNIPKISFNEAVRIPSGDHLEILALDDAIKSLAEKDARKSQIIELRFFGGLSMEETAEALGISVTTANREWRLARTWLYREIKGGS